MVLENLKRPPKPGSKIYIGLSGGKDSICLLHLIHSKVSSSKQDSAWNGINIKAVHVNHNLQKSSKKFELLCKETCQNLGIELITINLTVNNESIKKFGLEAAARKERLNAFKNLLKCKDDVLALGHHLDDQIETVFLQWMRGAGLEGLTGMLILDLKVFQDSVLKVWRPLLDTSRLEISKYVETHNLSWIEDPTNSDLEYDRNLIRHKVIPLLKLARTGAPTAMARSVQHLQSARLLLDNITCAALKNCETKGYSKHIHAQNLSKLELLKLDDILISRVLRAWLNKMGCSSPPTKRLLEFIRQLRSSSKKTGSLIEVNGKNGYKIISKLDELTLTIK